MQHLLAKVGVLAQLVVHKEVANVDHIIQRHLTRANVNGVDICATQIEVRGLRAYSCNCGATVALHCTAISGVEAWRTFPVIAR
jgi:hypothetical protein